MGVPVHKNALGRVLGLNVPYDCGLIWIAFFDNFEKLFFGIEIHLAAHFLRQFQLLIDEDFLGL